MNSLRIFSIFIFTLFSITATAQANEGILKGTVLDSETKEALPFANVELIKEGTTIGGAQTDFDGKFSINPIALGEYSIKVSYAGYHSILLSNIKLKAGKERSVTVRLKKALPSGGPIVYVCNHPGPVDLHNLTNATSFSRFKLRESASY